MTLLLKRIDWAAVNRTTRRQVGNREVFCPPISLFRWWARRPHALIGALLEASRLRHGELVSDPFSGGGTVALEAVTRGLRIYAQDLNPWATWGLGTALDGIQVEELEKGIGAFLETVGPLATREYKTLCPTHGASEIVHSFWVRECTCTACGESLYLFPYSMLTMASRGQKEKIAFYGCSACGQVAQRRAGGAGKCPACSTKLADDREALLVKRQVACLHCDAPVSHARAWSKAPRWRCVLVQRFCRAGAQEAVHFDVATEFERAQVYRHGATPTPLTQKIPNGRETDVLKRGGFRRWCDLYPPRQLRVLLRAAEVARQLDVSEGVRNRIQLAIAGAAEMAGFLCRWDRFHPKAFEAIANHRFSSLGLAVETNPLAKRGRGTIRKRLAASIRAARWSEDNLGTPTRKLYALTSHASLRPFPAHDVTVVSGSSTVQMLPDASVRLIVTDPPYYDAVQYGELASLFLKWAEVVRGGVRNWRPDLRQEAVPNPTRRVDPGSYERIVGTIFRETARTLRPDGRMLLTFHSTDFRGWAALGNALHGAKFRIVAMGVGHSENDKDHPKRGRRSFSKDLVLECCKDRGEPVVPSVVTAVRDSEHRELIAAGRAIAMHAKDGDRAMAQSFLSMTLRMRKRRIEVAQVLLRRVP